MKREFVLLSIISLIGCSAYASAMGGYDAGMINSQYMHEMRMHEFASRAKQKNAVVKTNAKALEQTSNPAQAAKIETFKFVNNVTIPSEELLRVVSYRVNEKATDEVVADLRKKIMRYYQANGFYSVLVFPNLQNMDKGELIFEIQEGSKDSITVE